MQRLGFAEQAEHCRIQARAFGGKSEGRLLLSVAAVFDELARKTGEPANFQEAEYRIM